MLAAANLRFPYGNGIPSYDSSNRLIPSGAGAGGPYVGDAPNQVRTQIGTFLMLMADPGGEVILVGQQNPPLSAFVDQSRNGSANDTGVLVTAVPAANQHGIPTNFGPGRGNWQVADMARLSVDIFYADPSTYGANFSWPRVILISNPAGNIVIVVKNQSNQDLLNMAIRLHYLHSQEM